MTILDISVDNDEPSEHGANKENGAITEENAEFVLTECITAINVDNEDSGVASMTDDPRLEQAFTLIREVVADADKRADERLMARITGTAVRPSQPKLFDEPSADKRAPRGSAAILIDRALAEAGSKGLTVIGIHAKAETDYEKMVTTSAIRNWLKENERKRPPKYRQVGGVWFLAQFAPTMKVVG